MSTVFVDPETIPDRFTQPFALAQTRLLRNSEVVVASLQLPEGWRADLVLLNLHLVGIESALVPDKISGNLNLVFAGFYEGIQGVNSNTGRPLVYVGSDVPGFYDSNPFGMCPLVQPGFYTVMLVNNTSNADFQVAVSGAFRLARF